MKKLLFTLLMIIPSFLYAQDIMEGTTYFLPKTVLKVNLLIEKTSITPGELHLYSERYLKKRDVATEASETYRIVSLKMRTESIPDTAKQFTARVDQKHSINSIKLNSEGIILAVNTDAKVPAPAQPFIPAPKKAPLNPHDYMNQDILASGSMAKMAELTAQEIIDIRESRSQLSKGQADFMPQDGAQLNLMLKNLQQQESALLQLFEGVTEKDTTEVELTYIPEQEVDRYILFRFSKKLGLVDRDDLAGSPYYISVKDEHVIPTNQAIAEEGKRSKDDANIFINMPGKIKVTIQGKEAMTTLDTYAAQFGKCASLDNELFGKKLYTQLVYNPITGNIESINTDLVKK